MSDNYGRTNLITRFTCSQCGDQLNLSYKTKKPGCGDAEEEDGITGAYKLEIYVSVEPCHKCMEPVRKVAEALATLNSLKKGK